MVAKVTLQKPLTAQYTNESGGGRVTLPAGHEVEVEWAMADDGRDFLGLIAVLHSAYGITVVASEPQFAAALGVG